ncbi:hypothetical protein Mapa_011281 [Marchantia paleacea]|nr:hypothetical protein Mapa_011281 [Marchantia paleacea]
MGTARSPRFYAGAVILTLDSILVALVIYRVPYTKIDWDAYMSQVTGFLSGERNYEELEGDTGPLVYPAGFLYFYSGIQYITAGAVFPAQILFGLLYVINLGLVLWIYTRTEVPLWGLTLLMLSKRIHSIFVLRLFNDCIATTLTHASLILFLKHRWHLGLTVFSIAVSVKMNVLLYAPPLLLLLLKTLPIGGVITSISCAAFVQLVVGLPFLLVYPLAYISRSFNLGRVFIHFWSVNFKFIPEPWFVSKPFAVALLALHLVLLFLFAGYKWCKHEKSGAPKYKVKKSRKKKLTPDHIVTLLFTGNFIGIVCARSLHYQFYSWYFYTLPYLLWKTSYPTILRLILFAVIEICWNVYPSNSTSSVTLLFCHLILLWGLWSAPSEYPYVREVENEIKAQ